MNYKKYASLFLAGTVSAVVSAEAYATEQEQFTSEVITSSPLVNAPQTSMTDTVTKQAIPTFTDETALVNFIIQQLENLEDGFEAQFIGDTSNLIVNKELRNLITAAQSENDYLMGIGTALGYSVSYTSNKATITFEAEYLISKQEQAFVDAEVARINAQILRPGMSDLEKVIAINEYIVKNTTYSFYPSTTPHAAYALFKEGKGVCQAYAMAAYHMFKAADIEAHYVTGYAGENHAWNLVKVNGEWYHIDPTWSDPTFTTPLPGLENFISYEYFLLSDDTLLAERTMDSRPNLPKATSKHFEIFRSIESIPFKFNGVQYILLPEFANNQFFYVNYEDNYAIDTLNLANNPLAIERFANVRAMDILATGTALYFVDIDKKLGLSKIDLQTKEVTNLYTGSSVTSIKLENGVVNAYSNSNVVYSEKVGEAPTPQPEVPDVSEQIEQITKLVNTISMPSKIFATQVAALQALLDELTDIEAQLPAAIAQKISYIQQQYKKMTTLSFPHTASWAATKKIVDAKKSWTVSLSLQVANTTANKEKITVVDMFGDAVAVAVTINGNKITVTPTQSYIEEVPYTLMIADGLQSESGKILPNGTHLTFMFEK